MKEIKLKETDLWIEIVPLDACDFEAEHFGDLTEVSYDTESGGDAFAVDGKYEVLGCVTKDHIDFDVEPITNATGLQGKEIFLQILKDNGILMVNPHGDKPEYDVDNAFWLEPRLEQWQQAESQLPPKVLILKKLK